MLNIKEFKKRIEHEAVSPIYSKSIRKAIRSHGKEYEIEKPMNYNLQRILRSS